MVDTADLNPELQSKLNSLLDGARQQGANPQLTSGYRTNQQQTALYNSGNGGVPVARPGTSLHEKGLAADVSGDAKTMQILHSLAPQYGLEFPFTNDPVHVQLKGAGGTSSGGTSGGQSSTGGRMPLLARMGIVMSMLGATPTTVSETPTSVVGQADTAQTQLATQASPPESTQQPTDQTQPSANATATSETPNGDHAANQQLGQQLAAKYGWDKGSQWNAFNNVVMRESGWDPNAANPTSDARGIAQNIHGWSDNYQQGNAQQQINWMLNYIQNRYGSPEAALAHEQKYSWY